jgi:hypothetical protein
MLSLWFGYDTVTYTLWRPFSAMYELHALDPVRDEPPTVGYKIRQPLYEVWLRVRGSRALEITLFGHRVR